MREMFESGQYMKYEVNINDKTHYNLIFRKECLEAVKKQIEKLDTVPQIEDWRTCGLIFKPV